jgi:hypothetical protein
MQVFFFTWCSSVVNRRKKMRMLLEKFVETVLSFQEASQVLKNSQQ